MPLLPCPPLRLRAHALHSRAAGEEAAARDRAADGRAIWWDKLPAELAQRRRAWTRAASQMKAYVYGERVRRVRRVAPRGARSTRFAPRVAVDEVARRAARCAPSKPSAAGARRARGLAEHLDDAELAAVVELARDDARRAGRASDDSRAVDVGSCAESTTYAKPPGASARRTIDQNAAKRACGTCDSQKLMNTQS